MDNKITKSRLSNFFAYEWVFLIVLALVGILVWELVYTMTSVRLTVGQQFKYYFDETVYAVSPENLNSTLSERFSYDVLSLDYESLTSEYNVLSTRLTVQEGDAIFTDITPDQVEEGKYKTNRANSLLDSYDFYGADGLLDDAKKYLAGFLKAELVDTVTANPSVMLNYDNLDQTKIENGFLSRMRKDNRFRKADEKKAGIELEKERIKTLCSEVAFYEKVLDYDKTLSAEDSLFYRYKRFDQSIATSDEKDKEQYVNAQAYLKEERYGLKMGKLTFEIKPENESLKKVEDIVKLRSDGKPDNVVLLTFNFLGFQPDLQFETIIFTNTLIKLCSDIPSKI